MNQWLLYEPLQCLTGLNYFLLLPCGRKERTGLSLQVVSFDGCGTLHTSSTDCKCLWLCKSVYHTPYWIYTQKQDIFYVNNAKQNSDCHKSCITILYVRAQIRNVNVYSVSVHPQLNFKVIWQCLYKVSCQSDVKLLLKADSMFLP